MRDASAAGTNRVAFDRCRAIAWLTSPAVVGPDGSVGSWVNPTHPGYPYPEAGGLLLRLLAHHPAHRSTASDIARWLEHTMATDGVGRDGHRYTFDLGVVLAALVAWAEARAVTGSDPLASAAATLLAQIASATAVDPPIGAARWSTRFGPHMLKLAVGLRGLDRLQGTDAGVRGIELLLQRVGAWDTEAAPTDPGRPTYVHAHAYAMEGLLAIADERRLPSATRDAARRRAERGIVWLAEIQADDGSLPAHHDGDRGLGPGHADATAQAIRLWCCAGRDRFGPAIASALTWLDAVTGPEGALRYHDQSDDANTWATIFAVQALDFVHGDPDPGAIL